MKEASTSVRVPQSGNCRSLHSRWRVKPPPIPHSELTKLSLPTLLFLQTCTHLWTLSHTFWAYARTRTPAHVYPAYARTHVPMPRRLLRKPTAVFYVCLFLSLVVFPFINTSTLRYKKMGYIYPWSVQKKNERGGDKGVLFVFSWW